MKQSDLEHSLYYVLRKHNLRGFIAEYRFGGLSGKRRWRMDVVYPRPDFDPPVAVECQGGLYSNGKHSRESGYRNDSEKSAEWQLSGGILISATPSMIADESIAGLVEEALDRSDK